MSDHPTSRPFGRLANGSLVECWTLKNQTGSEIEILTFGGIVRSLRVPDSQGRFDDVVLGFNSLDPYLAGHPYFGAITGRIAGRVTDGRISIGGNSYQLPLNNGGNHLHGGKIGLDKRLWKATPLHREDGSAALRLTYRSPDGEEGYPGNLDIEVTYTLTADHAFIVESSATTDQPTPLSLAHHSYFNLEGESNPSIVDHELAIFADDCVPNDQAFTLSGKRTRVAGEPTDFRRARRLADALPGLFERHGACYPLRPPFAPVPPSPTLAARVFAPKSGRILTVSTDESVLQFYSASMLDGSLTGKSGDRYGPHRALCLECHGYPDATTHPEFGDILVHPGRPQHRKTVYAFSVA